MQKIRKKIKLLNGKLSIGSTERKFNTNIWIGNLHLYGNFGFLAQTVLKQKYYQIIKIFIERTIWESFHFFFWGNLRNSRIYNIKKKNIPHNFLTIQVFYFKICYRYLSIFCQDKFNDCKAYIFEKEWARVRE